MYVYIMMNVLTNTTQPLVYTIMVYVIIPLDLKSIGNINIAHALVVWKNLVQPKELHSFNLAIVYWHCKHHFFTIHFILSDNAKVGKFDCFLVFFCFLTVPVWYLIQGNTVLPLFLLSMMCTRKYLLIITIEVEGSLVKQYQVIIP